MKHWLMLLVFVCGEVFAQEAEEAQTSFAAYSDMQNTARYVTWGGLGVMGVGLALHIRAISENGNKPGAAIIEAVGLGVQWLGILGNAWATQGMINAAQEEGKSVQMRGVVPLSIAWISIAAGSAVLATSGMSDERIAVAVLLYGNGALFNYIAWPRISGSADEARSVLGVANLQLMPAPVVANHSVLPGLVLSGSF